MKKRWIPFIVIAAMLGIGSIATADETEMDFYISEDSSEEMLTAADDEDEDLFAVDGLIEDLEAAENESQSIPIDEEHFPDEYFREYISSNFDQLDSVGNKDGILSADEISTVTEMHITSGPSSLDGINYFKALKSLIIANSYASIFIEDNTSLESVIITDSDGSISSTEIFIVNCPALKSFQVKNSRYNKFRVTGCASLTSLRFDECQIQTLDCQANNLTSLRFDKCKIYNLNCCYNKLTTLELNRNFLSLNCTHNQLKQLDITHCTFIRRYAYLRGNKTSTEGITTYNFDDYLHDDQEVKAHYWISYDSSTTLLTDNHAYGAWTVTKKPTTSSAGTKVRYCTICDHEDVQSIPVIAEKITITKKPTIQKPTATKSKITVKWKHFKHTSKSTKAIWKKIKKVQIQCATDKAFKNIVKTTTAGKSKTKGTIKGLQKKTTYYVRVRYYDGTGYSAWSKVKKIKTK